MSKLERIRKRTRQRRTSRTNHSAEVCHSFKLEPLEPRLLLSADSIVSGLSGSLTNGLGAVSAEIDQLIQDDPVFDKAVPGIVETLTLGDNTYEISPTLEEALNISADVYTGSNPSGATGTYKQRFQYIEGLDSC